ncbi:hypothetical protein ACLB2K_061697 [Fragaria x ananassa]
MVKPTREKWTGIVARFFEDMARTIPRRTRYKGVRFALGVYKVPFTFYRISKTMLLQTKHHVGRKVIGAMSSVRRMRDKLMKHCGVESEEESRWSNNLPEEILDLVLQWLCIQDYVRCRSVCLSWRGIIDMAIARKCIRPAPQLPWLVLRAHRLCLKDTCFLSLSDQKTYKPNPTHMNRFNCVGSIEGWLVMVDNAGWHPEAFMNLWSLEPWSFFIHRRYSAYTTVNYFFNPVSGARVMLPSQSAIP